MKPTSSAPANIDEYIAVFPVAVQALLQSVRQTVRTAAPEAQEKISYQIPTFTLRGNLIHFAAFKNHIGLYPGTAAIKAFEGELQGFSTAKGSVQFPLNEPLPLALIGRIVQFCVDEHLRAATKRRR